jgi:hypothetical protein
MTFKPSRLIEVGIAKGSTWGTPVAVGAGDGLLLTAENLTGSRTVEGLIDDSIGLPWQRFHKKGIETVAGTLDGYLRYDGISLKLLAAIMGADSTAPIGIAAGRHTMEPATQVFGHYWTLAVGLDSTHILEVPSFKVIGATWTFEMGQRAKFSYNCGGDVVNVNTETEINGEAGSPVNKPSTLAAVTFDATEETNIVCMTEAGRFQMSELTTDTLADVAITGGTVSFARPLEGARTVNAPNLGINELKSTTKPVGTASFNFDVTDAETQDFMEQIKANTQYFGLLEFVGDIMSGEAIPYKLRFEKRDMRIGKAAEAIGGDGKVPVTVDFVLMDDPTGTETGMSTAFDGPLAAYVENLSTTTHLA